MKIVWIIAQREYKRYFATPVAYMVSFMLLLILGFIFYNTINFALISQFTPGVETILGPLVFLLVFTTPAVTMRLLAEEQRLGTIELLLTSPVRDWELVVGKWLGGVLFLSTLISITLVYPFVLNQMVSPGIDQGSLMTGYLGLILVCGALVAVGVAVSALFSNQIAVFFTTFAVMVLLWIIGSPAQSSPVGNELLMYLDFRNHYNPTFLVGIVDIRDVIYYVSLTALSLFLGSVFVETRRWR